MSTGAETTASTNRYVPQWPGEMIDTGSRQLYVRHCPGTSVTAEPAVMIHGLGGSSTNWTELMDVLSDELDSFAVDLPGFGQSPPPQDDDYGMRVAADAVAEFICGEFADQSVHIFGNSMGGAVCVQLAAHHPELVRSITLVSPAMPELRPRLSSIHMPVTAVPGVGERLVRHSMLRQAEERVRASMEMCYAQIGRIHPDRWVEQVAEATQRETLAHAPTAVLGSLRALVSTYFDRSDERPWQLAGRIDVPVVLVYGRLDKLVNSRAAHRATREFKNARVVVVPDSGHVSQMEHPEIVADAWRELAR